MALLGLDHINIDTTRLDETIAFYTLLGLEHRPKPSGNPGAWMFLGERAVVHLNVIDEDRSADSTGSFNHVAFVGSDVEALCAALASGGHGFERSPRPDMGITQIFTTDPNGIAVELNVANL